MTHGSLFAGIGGFDLGFERAGITTTWMVENDPFCQGILRKHFPRAKLYGDIEEVDPTDLAQVDIISAGFPCEDVSVAGKRKGLKGDRSRLFFEARRIIEALRPPWVVLENVPGLLSSDKGRDFALVLGSLAELGYGVSWRILDSQFFGVPQRRRRVFIVGCLGRLCPPEILFDSQSGQGDTAQGRKKGQKATSHPQGIAGTVISKWATGCGGPAGDERYNLVAFDPRQDPVSSERASPSVGSQFPGPAIAYDALNDRATDRVPTLGQNAGQSTGRAGVIAIQANQRREIRISNKTAPVGQPSGTQLNAVICIKGSAIGRKPEAGSQRSITRTDKSYALDTKDPHAVCAPCETLDPDGMREASGVPRRLDAPDGPRYKTIGRAVTVPVAQWIGERLVRSGGR